jgi:hypothetical protein
MKKNKIYIRKASEGTGSTTAFTELEINASPEFVRAKFLEFDKWEEWNSVIPKIAIKTGDINNLETKPTLDLTLDFGRKNDPAQAPVYPKVYENSAEVFHWGFNIGLLKAAHVFIFESIDDGKKTRLIHYEKMEGILKFIMSAKMKASMLREYDKMNKALKRISEEASY